jgi:Recombination endonuclease VII
LNHNGERTHCIHGHEFTKENTYLDPKGHQRACRTCKVAYQKARHIANREKRNAISAQWQRDNPERTRERCRRWTWKQSGWTPEQVYKALTEQNNQCAICKNKVSLEHQGKGRRNRAQADHKHTQPPVPRAVLCSNCNLGLGNFMDSPRLLRVAAEYLEKY